MRKPNVKNKYNLDYKMLQNLQILNRDKINTDIFWRNNVINAWCISKSIGDKYDRQFGTEYSLWIGVYDKPFRKKYVHVSCDCYGGMCSYTFKKFFDMKDIKNEKELQLQEELLITINKLIDDGILGFPEE